LRARKKSGDLTTAIVPAGTSFPLGALGQGLKEAGYKGRNVAIKYRSAGGEFDRLPALAAELVSDPVAVIVAIAPPAAVAAKAATSTIPIVFTTGADPVDLGLVSSFNRPGGNVTGVNFFVTTLAAKRLELLRELVPSATVIGFLSNPTNPASDSETRNVQAAARVLGLELPVVNAPAEGDIDAAFASFVQQRVNAVIVGADALFTMRRGQLVGLAARHAISGSYAVRFDGVKLYQAREQDRPCLALGVLPCVLRRASHRIVGMLPGHILGTSRTFLLPPPEQRSGQVRCNPPST